MSDQPNEKSIQEVIALIEKLVDPVNLTETERDNLLDELLNLVPRPGASNLIHWPEQELSVREMAMEMLTYPPTSLGYAP